MIATMACLCWWAGYGSLLLLYRLVRPQWVPRPEVIVHPELFVLYLGGLVPGAMFSSALVWFVPRPYHFAVVLLGTGIVIALNLLLDHRLRRRLPAAGLT